MSISITAEKLFSWIGMPFTNTLVISFIVSLFLIISALIINKILKTNGVPGKMQNFLEMVIEGAFNFIQSTVGDRQKAEKLFGLVATFFILILFNNWVELWPGLGYVGLKEGYSIIPIIRSPSADLNTTLALAVISVFATQFLGITAIGVGKHLTKYFNFRSPIKFFVGILELISEISKILSFSFRLFGNIFAGEVLLILSCYFIPYFVPLPFLLMEVFVGLIQAFIFAMLTLSFIQIATIHE
ncbi:MAG TPA: ATP synthase F0 subunit A [Candidatus Portnoybacteria bacterium]|nr:ATP synthase F0 subunit A [Candidatus Portnoybacteria bacterium]